MAPDAPAALRRVLAVTGVRFPRGLLGDEARALASALQAGRTDVDEAVRATSAALWPPLRASTEAAVARGARRAVPEDAEAFELALGWAASEDPDNPLALSLALQAGSDLSAALGRSAARLESLADVLAGDVGAAAAARTAGLIAVDLLDLDPEDFEPEIAAYVAAEETVDALVTLARATGDEEVREWARESLRVLDAPEEPRALAAVRALAAGPPPPDPGDDPVWVATVQALAEEAIAIALAAEGE
jgi:hypothetical protein